jgi:hypothetical protein
MARALFCLLLFATNTAFCAFERSSHGSKAVGMGGASVAEPQNQWAAFSNPGSLASVNQRSLSIFYSPAPFELKELARGSFSFVEPVSFGVFSLSGSRFGFELYREVMAGVSFSRRLADQLQIGLSLDYYSLSIQNYGSASSLGLDVGLLLNLSDDVRWGVSALNINAPTIGVAKERLPQVFSTGICYNPIPEATINAELQKDIRYPTELHVGVEYTMFEVLSVRGGISGEPSTLNAGLGIRYSIFQFDYAFSEHPDLGMSHQMSLSLFLGEL